LFNVRRQEWHHCADWRPKEEEVEEWHGYQKGDRVKYCDEGVGIGTVTHGYAPPEGVPVLWDDHKNWGISWSFPDNLTRLPVKHEFKVWDKARVNVPESEDHGKLCRVLGIECDIVYVQLNGGTYGYHSSKLEPA
jgi:hypothetical protein